MVIIAVSDQHLGYNRADKSAFLEFLTKLSGRTDVTDLVVLGDFVDMWRRDASGVFLEHQDVVAKLLALEGGMKVHLVAGNHDFHALQLKKRGYQFRFQKNLELERDGKNYRFMHGYEWDDLQEPIFMEALCRVMSDSAGEDMSSIWDIITGGKGFFARHKLPERFDRGKTLRTLENLVKRPEVRLKQTIDELERRVCKTVRKDEILVFGHTHRPFVNKLENVVNCGSWVTSASDHNTYVEIEAGRPRLFVFNGEEITDRIDTGSA